MPSYDAQLGGVLVDAALFGYLGAVFTRDPFFSTGLFAAFWLFIFVPVQYPINTFVGADLTRELLSIFVYVPATAALASLVGLALVKMLDIGQLIDVWLTGSGGGSAYKASKNEELNLPLMPLAILFIFVGTFFVFHAGAGPMIFYGEFTIDTTIWYILGAVAYLFALALFISIGIESKHGNRYQNHHDYGSLYYTFAFGVVFLAPLILRPLGSGAGWIAFLAILIVVLDLVALGIGVTLERARDLGIQKIEQTPNYRYGRFYSIESAGTNFVLILRYVLVIGFHVGTYLFIALYDEYAATTVQAIFWPAIVLYTTISFFVLVVVYLLLFRVNRGKDSDEPLLGGDRQENVYDKITVQQPTNVYTQPSPPVGYGKLPADSTDPRYGSIPGDSNAKTVPSASTRLRRMVSTAGAKITF